MNKLLFLLICTFSISFDLNAQPSCNTSNDVVICAGEVGTFDFIDNDNWVMGSPYGSNSNFDIFTKINNYTVSILASTGYGNLSSRPKVSVDFLPPSGGGTETCGSYYDVLGRNTTVGPSDGIGLNTEYTFCPGENSINDLTTTCPSCEFNWELDGLNFNGAISYDITTSSGGNFLNFQDITFNLNIPGNYQLCVNVSHPDVDCIDTYCFDINIVDLTMPASFDAVGYNGNICEGQDIYFDNTTDFSVYDPTEGNFIWQVHDAVSGGLIASESNVDFLFEFDNMGLYNVHLYYSLQVGSNVCYTPVYEEQIMVSSAEQIDISCPSVVCSGSTIQYTISDPSIDCSLYVWSNTLGAQESVSPDNCTYTVTWENVNEYSIGSVILELDNCQNGNCCPTIVDVPIVPNMIDILGPTFLCQNNQSPITYLVDNIPGTFYEWTLTGPTGPISLPDNTDNVIEINFAEFGEFTLSVILTNPFAGCEVSADLIILNPKISGAQEICLGSSFELFYLLDEATVITYYITDFLGNPLQTNTQSSSLPIVFNPSLSGTYFLDIDNGGNCFEPVPLSVVMVDNLSISGETEVCPGTTYDYTVACGEGESVIWDAPLNGVIVSSTDCSVSIQWNSGETNFLVSGTKIRQVDDGLTCEEPLIPLDAMADMPTIFITGDSPTCYDVIGQYEANEIQGAFYSWTINPPFIGSVISGQGSNMINVQWLYNTNVASAELTCSINICGQSITSNYSVDFESFQLDISPDFTICEGDDASVTVFGLNGENLISWDAITWNVDGETITDVTSVSTADLGPGLNLISVTVINPNGCISTELLQTQITVNAAPGPLVETFRNMCPKETLTVNDLSVSVANAIGAIFVWTKNGVLLPDTGPTIFLTLEDILSTPIMPLIISVDVTLNGCTFTITENLGYACPSGDGNDPNGCPAFDADIVDWYFVDCSQIIVEGNLQALNNYNQYWEVFYEYQTTSQQLVFSTSIETAVDLFQKPNLDAGPGLYTIRLVSQYCCDDDGNLCTTFDLLQILIPFEQDFDYYFICNNNNSYDLVANDASIYAPNGVATSGINYSWYIDGVFQSSGLNSITATFNSLIPGSTVEIGLSMEGYGYGPDICPVYIQTIEVPLLPTGIIDISSLDNCLDQIITFDHGQENIISVLWDFGDGSMSQANPVVKIFDTEGTKTITLTVTDAFGCSNTAVNTIEVINNPFSGTLSYTMEGKCDAMADLIFTPDQGQVEVVNYTWSPGGDSGTDPSIMITQSGIYTVTVTDVNGCQHVFVSEQIDLDEAFSYDLKISNNECGRKIISYGTVNGYSYVQYTEKDGGTPDCGNQTSFNDEGDYVVTIYAFDFTGANCLTDINDACAIDQVSFTVVALPETPILLITSNCEDGSVTINISNYNPNYEVLWYGDNILPVANEQSITVFENGLYRVSFTDPITGCSSIGGRLIRQAKPDFENMITGCYSFCEDDDFLVSGFVYPPDYQNFGQWKWLLDGNQIPGAIGGGIPNPLDLSTITFEIGIEYKITFAVSINGCTFESDPFCLTVEECPDCLVYADGQACGIDPVDCAVSPEDGSPIFFINTGYLIPSGEDFDPPAPGVLLTYCHEEPFVVANGSFTLGSAEQIGSDQLNLIGSFIVDDPSNWSVDDPIIIQINYCGSDGDSYCVQYEINEKSCPNDPLECNVWFTGFESGKDKGDDDNYYANYCVMLYDVESDGCNSTEWDIEGIVRSIDGTETTIYNESVSIAGEGKIVMHCFSVPIPNEFDVSLNPYLGFNITSNCPGIGCFHEFYHFGTANHSSNPIKGLAKKNCGSGGFDVHIPNEAFKLYAKGEIFLNGSAISLGSDLTGTFIENAIHENLPQNLAMMEYFTKDGKYQIKQLVLDVDLCLNKRSANSNDVNAKSHAIKLYPNPFSKNFRIIGTFDALPEIVVTDALGNIITAALEFSDNNLMVDIEASSGVYFISLFEDGDRVFIERVVKIE